jgi:hypothetical protein
MQGCPSTMYAAGAACTESSLTALTRSHRCDGNRVSGQRSTCGEPRATSTRHAMPPPHPARHASSLVSACHPRDAQTFERHPQRANAAYRGCVASHQHCSYVGFNVCAARGGGVPALCPHHQIPLETTPPVYNASNLRQCWCIKNTYTVRGAGPGGVSRARPSALTPILPERPPWHGVRRDQHTTVSVRRSTYTRWVAMARCGWESLPSTGSTVSRRVGGS